MLNKFDWLRRCRSGTELLATLKYFSDDPEFDPSQFELGGPISAIGNLCQRCRVYSPVKEKKKYTRYCRFCEKIIQRKEQAALKSYSAVVLWGYVNQISRRLRESKPSRSLFGIYIHDDQHFLIMMHRQYLKQWLQDLVIYSGLSLKGLLQIFPSIGEYRNLHIGDYLTWAIHHEATFLMDQLRVLHQSASGYQSQKTGTGRIAYLHDFRLYQHVGDGRSVQSQVVSATAKGAF